MAMSEQEWHDLLAKNRRSTGNRAIGTRRVLVVLVVSVWMMVLAPTTYLVVTAVENLPGLSLSQHRVSDQAWSR
jgi:hypothetical protein